MGFESILNLKVEKQTQMRATFPSKQIRVPLSTITTNIKNDVKQNVLIEVTPSIKLTKSQMGKMNLDAMTPLSSKMIETKDTGGKRKNTSSTKVRVIWNLTLKVTNISNSQKEIQTQTKHSSECTGTQTEKTVDLEIEQEKQKEIINCLQETIENQLLEIQSLRTKLDSNQEKPMETKKVEEVSLSSILESFLGEEHIFCNESRFFSRKPPSENPRNQSSQVPFEAINLLTPTGY